MAGRKGRSGRRRKPSALRTGHRRYNNVEPVPSGDIVPPPMTDAAHLVWNALLPIVTDMRVMTAADVWALKTLCELEVLFAAAPHPRVAAQLRNFYHEFGLSPSARAHLHVPPSPDDEPTSPFAGMGFM